MIPPHLCVFISNIFFKASYMMQSNLSGSYGQIKESYLQFIFPIQMRNQLSSLQQEIFTLNNRQASTKENVNLSGEITKNEVKRS